MQTPLRLEGFKDQADDPLGLLVRVQLIIAVGSADIPPWGDDSAVHRAEPCGASLPTDGLS